MIFVLYLLLSAVIAAALFAAPGRRTLHAAGSLFYLVQAAFAAWLFAGGGCGQSAGALFEFDAAGSLFFVLLVVFRSGGCPLRRPNVRRAAPGSTAPTLRIWSC